MNEDISAVTDERTPEQLDQLADNADVARNSERPMSAKDAEPTKESPSPKEDYEFVHNGKPVKGTREQILKWAQMGYDRPQVMNKINEEKKKWDQEKAQFEQLRQKFTPYQQIDEWAVKNPTQWQKIQELYGQAQQNPNAFQQQGNYQGQPSQNGLISPEFQPYISKIQSLEQQLSQIIPHVQQFNEWRTNTTQKEEDTKLETEIQSIRDQHKDLDWASIDENGKSLEMKVLEHAQTTGIPTFRAALRDLLHDDLMNRAQAQAKQSVAKGIQTRTKLGVLGESPTPQKGRESNIRDIRNTSYEEIERDIREELRRGVS